MFSYFHFLTKRNEVSYLRPATVGASCDNNEVQTAIARVNLPNGSTVVRLCALNPKVSGLSPATGTAREGGSKKRKKFFQIFRQILFLFF